MTRTQFWDHIRATRRRDPEEHAEQLVNRLAKLPGKEILDFDYWWDVALGEAYQWNLWGAAYLINGGCSDDGFEYFCRWLILQGKDIFQIAVKKPDSLADVVDPDEEELECECYPGMDAWFAATKTAQDEAGYEAFGAARKARRRKPTKSGGMGRRWDFDNDAAMRRRFPRLAALYLDRED